MRLISCASLDLIPKSERPAQAYFLLMMTLKILSPVTIFKMHLLSSSIC